MLKKHCQKREFLWKTKTTCISAFLGHFQMFNQFEKPVGKKIPGNL
jgi:hypothetical protein